MTLSQLESIRTARLQLIDLGDEKTAALLDWAVTAEPAADREPKPWRCRCGCMVHGATCSICEW